MKIINDKGTEIPEKEFKEKLEAIEEALKFYAEKKFFEWDGCHCHGHYNILDRGYEAEKGLNAANSLKYKIEDQEAWE